MEDLKTNPIKLKSLGLSCGVQLHQTDILQCRSGSASPHLQKQNGPPVSYGKEPETRQDGAHLGLVSWSCGCAEPLANRRKWHLKLSMERIRVDVAERSGRGDDLRGERETGLRDTRASDRPVPFECFNR